VCIILSALDVTADGAAAAAAAEGFSDYGDFVLQFMHL